MAETVGGSVLVSGKPGMASSIPGGGGLLWLVLGKGYLLTFPNRSARCLYTVTGCDRVGFSDGEEPPPITCVAARKIVESPWPVNWYSGHVCLMSIMLSSAAPDSAQSQQMNVEIDEDDGGGLECGRLLPRC